MEPVRETQNQQPETDTDTIDKMNPLKPLTSSGVSGARKPSQPSSPPPAGANRRKSSVRRPSIASDKLGPMHMAPLPKKGPVFNVVFIGAGNINFGSDEGPWNHSFRLEHKLGPRLKVVAIVDPATSRAESVLEQKRNSFVVSAYEKTRICKTIEDFHSSMNPDGSEIPHAVIIGSPPAYHGSDQPGRDMELKLIQLFPKVALFIEKPISTDSVQNALSVARQLEGVGKTTVCTVGYMLRYLKVVQKMKEIIEENELHVMATVARYVASYAKIAKPAWWNKAIDCGPIVEQATHFCDLSRYFGGDVDLSTIQAHSLEHDEEAGHLAVVPVDEKAIPAENRIPRVTSATWKYLTGAVGSLTHALVLQGTNYSTELEVYADGFQLRLVDPYNKPTLYVRRPTSDAEETHTFADDDPYFSEISAFIDACEGPARDSSALADDDELEILSSFTDAVKSYAMTWAIREASERTRRPPASSVDKGQAKIF